MVVHIVSRFDNLRNLELWIRVLKRDVVYCYLLEANEREGKEGEVTNSNQGLGRDWEKKRGNLARHSRWAPAQGHTRS